MLVPDPQGRLHLLLARRYDATGITGIESSHLLANVCRDIASSPPDRRTFRLLADAGRSWLMGGKETYRATGGKWQFFLAAVQRPAKRDVRLATPELCSNLN